MTALAFSENSGKDICNESHAAAIHCFRLQAKQEWNMEAS